MPFCSFCGSGFTRSDNLNRHIKKQHTEANMLQSIIQGGSSQALTFQHPFSMVLSGPSGSGKTKWISDLLHTSLISPSPQRILWCYGQWQPLYEDMRKQLPNIEFIKGIPHQLSEDEFVDTKKRNLIVFDDLMSEAKCDQRIADLFTRGSHHRNLSVIYFTQNLFPQGKACRDISLNTQYLVLFNNPIDRQQVATLSKRIFPSGSAYFMKIFEQAARPYGYLVVDLKAGTPETDRLHTDIFEMQLKKLDDPHRSSGIGTDQQISLDSEEESIETTDSLPETSVPLAGGPPGKRQGFRDEDVLQVIWTRRFKDPLTQANTKRFKTQVKEYMEEGQSFHNAFHNAANRQLPGLRKQLRSDYSQFLIDFYQLQEDPVQQRILESAKTLRHQHDMSLSESIIQAIKLRKDLFEKVWPNHISGQNKEEKEEEEEDMEDVEY